MDVIVPNSPLEVHLRRYQLSPPNETEDQPKQQANSLVNLRCRAKALLTYIRIPFNYLYSPWHLIELFSANHLLSYSVENEVVSTEEAAEFFGTLAFSMLSRRMALTFIILTLTLIFLFGVSIWFTAAIIGVFLPALPFGLNSYFFIFVFGPRVTRLTKSFRRCTNLLTEIQVVNMGFACAAKLRPKTDLLDQIARQQSNEAVTLLQNSLFSSMEKVQILVNQYFECASPPSGVLARRLVAGRVELPIFQEHQSSVTVQVRHRLSITTMYLFDLIAAHLRCLLFFSSSTLGSRAYILRLLFSCIRLNACFREIDEHLEEALKAAIFADLNNNYSQLDQMIAFNSKLKQSDDCKDYLRSFVLNLNAVCQKSISEILPVLSLNHERPPSQLSQAVLNDLTLRLQTCVGLLSQATVRSDGNNADGAQNNNKQATAKTPLETADSTLNTVPLLEQAAKEDDDLELFFADVAEEDALPHVRDNVASPLAVPVFPVNFLSELRSVLTERTKATETKEREILMKRGIDLDHILDYNTDAETKATDSSNLRPHVVLDDEAISLRAALVADLKRSTLENNSSSSDGLIRRRLPYVKRMAEEVVFCDSSSSLSEEEQQDDEDVAGASDVINI